MSKETSSGGGAARNPACDPGDTGDVGRDPARHPFSWFGFPSCPPCSYRALSGEIRCPGFEHSEQLDPHGAPARTGSPEQGAKQNYSPPLIGSPRASLVASALPASPASGEIHPLQQQKRSANHQTCPTRHNGTADICYTLF